MNNDENVQKGAGKNRFWDDCGTWESKIGHTLKSHYLRRADTLTWVGKRPVLRATQCER